MRTKLPLHSKWNKDKLEVVDDVFQKCQQAGLNIPWDTVEHIIDEYESLFIVNIAQRFEQPVQWHLPHVCIIFQKNLKPSDGSKNSKILSKTFNEVFVSLYK